MLLKSGLTSGTFMQQTSNFVGTFFRHHPAVFGDTDSFICVAGRRVIPAGQGLGRQTLSDPTLLASLGLDGLKRNGVIVF